MQISVRSVQAVQKTAGAAFVFGIMLEQIGGLDGMQHVIQINRLSGHFLLRMLGHAKLIGRSQGANTSENCVMFRHGAAVGFTFSRAPARLLR